MGVSDAQDFDDTPFDAEAVAAGAWAPGPYGPEDERGTFNEVTPEKTAAALARLDLTRPVKTYELSETLHADFPAHADRRFQQTLYVHGSEPPEGFAGLNPRREPISSNLICSLEERVSMSFNMGTKINGLHHAGVGGRYYNGFTTAEIAEDWGTSRLGMEGQGPIVTRGVVVDVLGHKVASGVEADLEWLLQRTAHAARAPIAFTSKTWRPPSTGPQVRDPIGPGDVVLFRTGWRELLEVDPRRYMEGARSGPFLRECRHGWRRARSPSWASTPGSSAWRSRAPGPPCSATRSSRAVTASTWARRCARTSSWRTGSSTSSSASHP